MAWFAAFAKRLRQRSRAAVDDSLQAGQAAEDRLRMYEILAAASVADFGGIAVDWEDLKERGRPEDDPTDGSTSLTDAHPRCW